jgi:hypothetical protein
MTSSPLSLSLPVLDDVDVLVMGAQTSAAAAALAAARAGRKVLAVSDRSYFGEDLAGAYELWPAAEIAPALRAMLGIPPQTPSAAWLKHALDTVLLDANASLLFHVRPVAVLRTADGRIGGAVLAHRTSLFAVRAKAVIDASRHLTMARLCGAAAKPIGRPFVPSLVALSETRPSGWAEHRSLAIGTLPPPEAHEGKKNLPRLTAWRLLLETPKAPESLIEAAAWEHRCRTQVLAPEILATAEAMAPAGTWWPCDTTEAARQGVVCLPMPSAPPEDAWDAAARQVEAAQAAANTLLLNDAPLATPAAPPQSTQSAEILGFVPAFIREPRGAIAVELPAWEDLGSCDVLVAGGGTAGACAGIAASEAGARTVVLEMLHGLGGVGTLGQISIYYWGNRVGFTAAINEALTKLDPAPLWAHGNRWNPELKMAWFGRQLAETGGAAWLGSFACGVRREGNRVTGVLVSTPFGPGVLACGCAIDATGSSDLAAAAGAACRVIDDHHVAVQGTGLSPRTPGVPYRNSDHTFIDDSDPANVTHAFVESHAKFRGQFDVGPLVNSRERRQIVGDIELSPVDFLAARTYPDTITTAISNFDTHGFTIHPIFLVQAPDKSEMRAHVPYRCLLPKGLDGLLVTGLGISAHRDAIPVVRMQADVQNQGFAAGLAAARAATGKLPLRAIPIRALQAELVRRGVLDPEVSRHEDSFPLPPKVIKEAVANAHGNYTALAIVMSHREIAQPIARQALAAHLDLADPKAETLALILGLWGDPAAGDALAQIVSSRDWDEGWNFRGMSQFGFSFSRMDALLAALARTGHPLAAPCILAKAAALGPDPALSHCRAIAIAAGAIGTSPLAPALARLLDLPGIQGHAQIRSRDAITAAQDTTVDNTPRNLALRELYLARGLFLCGDLDGLGRKILGVYARDLRGHFARHAQAILAAPDLASVRAQGI